MGFTPACFKRFLNASLNQDFVFCLKIMNDALLVPVEPSGEDGQQQLQLNGSFGHEARGVTGTSHYWAILKPSEIDL
jgi:hypothetical protein